MKVASTVLRGRGGSNAALLPDNSWSVLLGRATPDATFKVEWLSGCLTSIILAGRRQLLWPVGNG